MEKVAAEEQSEAVVVVVSLAKLLRLVDLPAASRLDWLACRWAACETAFAVVLVVVVVVEPKRRPRLEEPVAPVAVGFLRPLALPLLWLRATNGLGLVVDFGGANILPLFLLWQR